jgi:hypothetical protein
MTTVANDTSRIPLQATMTLLSQLLVIVLVTAIKLIFLLLQEAVVVDLDLEAEAEQEGIAQAMEHQGVTLPLYLK